MDKKVYVIDVRGGLENNSASCLYRAMNFLTRKIYISNLL